MRRFQRTNAHGYHHKLLRVDDRRDRRGDPLRRRPWRPVLYQRLYLQLLSYRPGGRLQRYSGRDHQHDDELLYRHACADQSRHEQFSRDSGNPELSERLQLQLFRGYADRMCWRGHLLRHDDELLCLGAHRDRLRQYQFHCDIACAYLSQRCYVYLFGCHPDRLFDHTGPDLSADDELLCLGAQRDCFRQYQLGGDDACVDLPQRLQLRLFGRQYASLIMRWHQRFHRYDDELLCLTAYAHQPRSEQQHPDIAGADLSQRQ